MKRFFLITLFSISVISCSTSIFYTQGNYPYENIVIVKILSIDTSAFVDHVFYSGREMKTNKIIYLISKKDSTFKFDFNKENMEIIYPFKIYSFEIVKASSNIAMWKYYPRTSGYGFDIDSDNFISIWSNGKFDVDVYTSPNLIDKYYIKK
ncbi:MAG TPA: hypothetical protein PLG90_11325 [Ignavibacteria bacterium]|nr:hypothetical protein [Ignavibacteria bacterium]